MMDSIKKAFMLSAAAAKVFCVITVFNIILNVISFIATPPSPSAEIDVKTAFTVITVTLLFFLLMVFMQGGILAYIKELIKSGSAGLASFISNGARYFLRMLGISIAISFIVLGWSVLFFGVISALLPALKGILMIAALILFISILIAVVILLILPTYALVGSDLGVMAALRRGVSIAASNFLQVIGILLIIGLIGIVLIFVASFIIGLLSMPLGKQAGGYITAVTVAIVSAALTLLGSIAYMDFYLKKA